MSSFLDLFVYLKRLLLNYLPKTRRLNCIVMADSFNYSAVNRAEVTQLYFNVNKLCPGVRYLQTQVL